MPPRISEAKGKKNKSSSTPASITVAELGDQAITDAQRRVNLAMDKDHEHDRDSDNEGSESTSSEYFSAEEIIYDAGSRTKGPKNTLKDTTDLLVLKADDNACGGSLSTTDKGDSAKSVLGQGTASRDEDKIPVRVAGFTDPVKIVSYNAQVLQNATNFKIENSPFYIAGGHVHVTNIYNDALFSRIAYADGAGIDTTKACLEGTRIEILDEIKGWVTTTDATAAQVFWLSGPAGTGKSAIAHSVARWWMEENDGIGSCFCFNRQAITRHERLFPTIALDLAARIPALKDSLMKAITRQPALATTVDVTQQWRKLLQEPLTNIPGGMTEPVLIVIDAVDESGGPLSRRHILSILAKDAAKLPSNFRILVTSRPLADIGNVFQYANSVRLESMDKLPRWSTERDIQLYISLRLEDVEGFGNQEFARLAGKADGLFEWARLACEHIQYAQGLLTERERFEELIYTGEGKELLDTMYTIILRSILGDRPHDSTIDRFRSVLRIVLSTLEPLPRDSLNVLHSAAVSQDRARYDVGAILRPLASLLSGVSDHSMPIRPLHSTFHEFLTSRDRSGPFFVDMEDVNRDLACACLQVMQQHLCFNICKLESSYIHNSEIADLEERIKDFIKPYLAYSCQFWTGHIKLLSFEADIAEDIKGILLNKKMLFWLEVLALLRLMGMVPNMLSIVASWLQNKDYEEVSAAARDGIKFVRMIGGVVSESTPHLYLSGLPFLPKKSILSRYLKAEFPNIPRIVFGGAIDWPSLQLSIRGHAGSVNSVAFSPDGKKIASGSDDKTIFIWDTEIGLQVGSPLKGHTGWVTSVAYSLDGKRIASGSNDKTIYIWDTETGLQVGNPLKGHTDWITSVAFSPDGKRIASSSNDKTVFIWDAETGLQVGSPLKGHTGPVSSVAFSPDGKRMVSGSSDETTYIWDTEAGMQVGNPLKGHTGPVSSVAFSPDGKKIASGSAEKTIHIWDAVTGLQVCNPLKGHTSWVYSVAFSPDGTRIASGSSDKTIHIWDAETGLQVGNPLKGHTGWVASVVFSPDGKRIASSSSDKTIYIWGAETGLEVNNPFEGNTGPTGFVTSVSFSPDGKRIASGSNDGTINIWDTETGLQVGNPLKGHTYRVASVAFSPDGKRIASGSDDKTIYIWAAETGLQIGNPLQGHTRKVTSVAFSPDGKKIASGSADTTINIWDAETGLQVGNPLEGHTSEVTSVAFSPDGKRIASGSNDETICFWDAETGLQVGNPLTGNTSFVTSVSFSPDGKKIASGSSGKTIHIWDVETGLQVSNPLRGHTGWVASVAFSPDGKRIVSGSSDKTIHIWDAETGLQVCNPLKGHTSMVSAVAFSPDGKTIASGSYDQTIYIWDAGTQMQMISILSDPHSGNLVHGPISRAQVIKFSPAEAHALYDSSELFHGTTGLHQDWREHVVLDSDGWILGPQSHLLMWIPEVNRKCFLLPKVLVTIPKHTIELDLSSMAHGSFWDKCYDG